MQATPSVQMDASQPFGDNLSADIVAAMSTNKKLSFAALTGDTSTDPKAHLDIVQVIALGGSNYGDVAAMAHTLWLNNGSTYEADVMYDLFTDEQILFADHLNGVLAALTPATDIIGNRTQLRFSSDYYRTRRMLKVINPDYVYVDEDGVEHAAITGFVYYVNPLDGSKQAVDPTRTAFGQEIPWTFIPAITPDGEHYLQQVDVKGVKADEVLVGDRRMLDVYVGVTIRSKMIDAFTTVLKDGTVSELDTSKRLDARVFGKDAQLIFLCAAKHLTAQLSELRAKVAGYLNTQGSTKTEAEQPVEANA